MGEYFKEHKLGTCEHLMYITREEVERFSSDLPGDQANGLRRYLTLEHRYIYRFPRETEQIVSLVGIDKRSGSCYIRLNVPASFGVPHGGSAQVEMKSVNGWSEFMNLDFCPASPEWASKFKPTRYCGWPEQFESIYQQPLDIVGNKYTPEHPDGYTLFRCPVCDSWFACDEGEIEDVIKPAMKKKGYIYEVNHLKAFVPTGEERKSMENGGESGC